MTDASLQDAIDKAGSPVHLLWKPDAPTWQPDVPAEFVGWGKEQTAAYDGVALYDQSRHIDNVYIEGPDALRLLSDVYVNNFDSFEIGQAKQSVSATEDGAFVGDGILSREGKERFNLNGIPFGSSWLRYHGETGDYDLEFSHVAPVNWSGDNAQAESLFRYQVQGPQALDLVEAVFGAPLPRTKFFHSVEVELDGRSFRALRHGMSGQPGYEFIGPYKHATAVKEALLAKGDQFGLVQVGAQAYSLNGLESGWVPMPTAGIYDAATLRPYREWLSANSFEAHLPLKGSFFSPDIRDYYSTPYELGYGRLISFGHDFIGKSALEQIDPAAERQKVTLVLDAEQAAEIWGKPRVGFEHSYGRYRVEVDGKLIGIGYYTGSIAHANTVMVLALVDPEYAKPGTQVTYVWGEHPGFDADPNVEQSFARIQATVQTSPYNEYARGTYRQD